MSAIACQDTNLTIVYSTIHSGADQSFSSLAVGGEGDFTDVRRIPRTKGQ